MKEKLVSQTATNILDWQSGFASPVGLEDIAAVLVPTVVVCGGQSHMAMRRCNQLLADQLPHSDFRIMEGANHFMIGTHAPELKAIIASQISA